MAANTVASYTGLITSEYAQQPNFISMISQFAAIYVQIQTVFLQMISAFDLNQATGNQLDIIGQWVGVTRNVSIPISGVYFTWNGTQATGWNYGTWQPSNAPAQITSLPDDAFLTLIKAKIASNSWDGTINGAYAIWDALFTDFTILIQDNYNMSYNLAIVGGIVDSLTLALITGGYIPLRPEGVEVANYYVSTDTNPSFCWDVESTLLQGWNQGSWLKEVVPI
jgi:hypothetical protein